MNEEKRKPGRPKQADKNLRQSIGETGEENSHSIRPQMGKSMKLDASPYQKANPNMKFMWVNDLSGEVQRWLDAGAELVPESSRKSKIYKGFNDARDLEWVKRPEQGFDIYLLMISPDDYDYYKMQPIEKRQNEIRIGMGLGVDQSGGSQGMPGGNIQTYAPEVGDGKQGFNQIT